jgi:hypothetical protein
LPPYGKRKKWCVRVVPSDDLKWNDPGKETSGHRFSLSNVNLLASYMYMIKPKFGYVKVEFQGGFCNMSNMEEEGYQWGSHGVGRVERVFLGKIGAGSSFPAQ